ncbi:MAG TPA: DUF3617 domain-containing protein [Allosphingosinicella sp.]|nr:DUF3617 domain-containing protein [Allosphingosinicella sp.]
MKLPAAALIALLATACNSQNDAGANQAAPGNSAVAPAPAPAAPATTATMRPGRWEMTMRVVSLDMPGASPELLAQLRAQPMPPAQTQASCMTPEEAADMVGNFRRQIVRDQPNLDCTISDQQFGGGRIRVGMSCRGLNGQPDQRLAMVGGFNDSSIQVAVSADSSTQTPNGMQAVRIESTLTGRRTGECNGTETD